MVDTKKNKSKVGILGYGEVGQAIAKFYLRPLIKTQTRDDGLAGVEILHICIPWSEKFVDIVKKEIKNIKPKLVIVHSTVAPGTIKRLGQMVVHSPIRGLHPDLYKGVKTFVKYIGADNKKAAKLAADHFRKLKIKTRTFSPSSTTELGKLLDTTYYGVIIAWHKEMRKMADGLGIDFEKAITDFNSTYNEGYLKLGKKNFVRPVLYADKKPIGGHCIIPNAEILN